VVALRQPGRLGIWYPADIGTSATFEGRLLAIDVTDLETLVLWPFEDLVTMETVEGVGGVLASWVGGYER
jgi:hypothetical protein